MTLRYLLDTTLAGEPVVREPEVGVLRKLEKRGAECAIAAPVWQELLLAVEGLPAGSPRRVLLERYLQEVVKPSFPICRTTTRPPRGRRASGRGERRAEGDRRAWRRRSRRSPSRVGWRS